MILLFMILNLTANAASERCFVMDRKSGGIIGEFTGKCSRNAAPREEWRDRVKFIIAQDKELERKAALIDKLKRAAPGETQTIKDMIELIIGEPLEAEKVDDLLPIPPPELPTPYPVDEKPGIEEPVPPLKIKAKKAK